MHQIFEMNQKAVYRHLERDPVMKEVIRVVHANGPFQFPPPSRRPYRDLLEAVIYQQVSIRAAKSIFDRFRQKMGEGIDDPQALLEMRTGELRSLGISGRKAFYLENIAHTFNSDPGLGNSLFTYTDSEVTDRLIRIRGVGVWTAKMILMFSLGRKDVFPVEDLGIRQAMIECYALEAVDEGKESWRRLQEMAAGWSPCRSFACHLLWRWKRIKMGIDY